jgi:outer membrane receptor protein involved in Fe transport
MIIKQIEALMRLFLLLISFAFLTFSYAQEISNEELFQLSLDELMEIKIDIASKDAEDIFNTPSTVVVIDKKMINEYCIKTIGEAINLISGFSNTRTFFKRNIPTSRGILQDNYANKVLLMINGIPTWHATAGEANIDRININDVDRIEILKGPASVLYGSNALTGAINIVLKQAENHQANYHFASGENSYFEGGGNYSLTKDNYSVFISGNASTENGNDYLFTDEENLSGYVKEYIKSSNFNLYVKYGMHSILFNTYHVEESFLGKLPRFSFGAGKNHINNGYLLNYSFVHNISEEIILDVKAAYDWNLRDFASSADDSLRAINEGYRLFSNLNLSYSPLKELRFDLGAEYEYRKNIRIDDIMPLEDRVISHNNSQNRDLYEYSFNGQVEYNNNKFKIIGGARSTQNQLFGNNISSRGTALYKFNKKNSIKFIYGSSYRAPSFFELYFVTPSHTVFGNPALHPEKAVSYEAAYLSHFNDFFMQMLVYHAGYKNKIYREKRTGENGNPYIIYVNGKTFQANGLEFELKYRNPSLFNSFFYYSYILGDKGDEINGNYNFKYVPVQTASFGISAKLSFLEISSVINYWSKTEGSIHEIGAQIFADLNFSFSQSFQNTNIKHNLSIRNITDEELLVPEYVRRSGINEVSFGFGRRIMYMININLN